MLNAKGMKKSDSDSMYGIARVIMGDRRTQSGLIHQRTRGKRMDLNLTPQEQQFRDEFRAWLASNAPVDWEDTHGRSEDSRERFDFLRSWQKRMYEAGWV